VGRLRLEEAKESSKGLRVTPPVLGDHISPRRPKQVTKDQGGDDRVIKGADDGDELGDEVDGRGHPRRAEDEEHLGSARYPGIPDEALEQHEQVRQQRRHLPRAGASPREVQGGDRDHVDGGGRAECDQ
jgi:hypothetical protein